MKRVTIIIDREEAEEIFGEHLGAMFPGLEVESISGFSYGDITVRLRKPLGDVDPAPMAMEPLEMEPLGDVERAPMAPATEIPF